MSEQLRAGAATANITPWLGIAMRGAFRDVHCADTVHDDLLAKALVLDDGARQIAFVLCDLTMMPRSMMDAVKERIAERCSIPADHVLIASTHTHSAPATVTIGFMEEQTEYTAWATRKIADAVEVAVRRLQPARIGFASVSEPRIVFNRRYHMRNGQVHFNPGVGNPDVIRPAGTTDPEFTLCYVESNATVNRSPCWGTTRCTTWARIPVRRYPPTTLDTSSAPSNTCSARKRWDCSSTALPAISITLTRSSPGPIEATRRRRAWQRCWQATC